MCIGVYIDHGRNMYFFHEFSSDLFGNDHHKIIMIFLNFIVCFVELCHSSLKGLCMSLREMRNMHVKVDGMIVEGRVYSSRKFAIDLSERNNVMRNIFDVFS